MASCRAKLRRGSPSRAGSSSRRLSPRSSNQCSPTRLFIARAPATCSVQGSRRPWAYPVTLRLTRHRLTGACAWPRDELPYRRLSSRRTRASTAVCSTSSQSSVSSSRERRSLVLPAVPRMKTSTLQQPAAAAIAGLAIVAAAAAAAGEALFSKAAVAVAAAVPRSLTPPSLELMSCSCLQWSCIASQCAASIGISTFTRTGMTSIGLSGARCADCTSTAGQTPRCSFGSIRTSTPANRCTWLSRHSSNSLQSLWRGSFAPLTSHRCEMLRCRRGNAGSQITCPESGLTVAI
mmetsp:Transcript_19729/g.46359  ORF Transcript_19729/g.46359 Transcript_19729/m.46359 type:complete len:292 (+) Transcript_19729:515-1390(+)